MGPSTQRTVISEALEPLHIAGSHKAGKQAPVLLHLLLLVGEASDGLQACHCVQPGLFAKLPAVAAGLTEALVHTAGLDRTAPEIWCEERRGSSKDLEAGLA